MKLKSVLFSEDDTFFDKISWISLLITVFLVPLMVGYIPLPGNTGIALSGDLYYGLKLVILAVGTAVALVSWGLSVIVKGRKIWYSPVLIPLALFVAWGLVSTLMSDYSSNALIGWNYHKEGYLVQLLYAALLFMALQYVRTPRKVRTLLVVLFSSSVIISTYGILQSLGIEFMYLGKPTFDVSRAFSTYGNPDMLGGFLVITTPLAFTLALSEETTIGKAIFWSGALLNSWCLVASFTRGAWLGATVGLVLLAVFFFIKKHRASLVDYLGLGAITVVVALVIVASLSNPVPDINFANRVSDATNASSPNVSARLEFWKSAVEATKDSPFVGHGFDTYALFSSRYVTPETSTIMTPGMTIDNPHNYYLATSIAVGIVGLVFLLAFFAWLAVSSVKALWKRPGSNTALLMFGIWATCAAYLAFLITGLSVAGVTFLFWLLLGVMLVPNSKAWKVNAKPWPTRMVAIPAFVLAVILTVMFGRFFVASALFVRVHDEPDATEQISIAERASNLDPYQLEYRLQIPLGYVERADNRANEYLASGRTKTSALDLAIEDYEKAIPLNKEIITDYPYAYQAYINLAGIYNSLALVTEDSSWADKGIEIAEKAEGSHMFDTLAKMQIARAYYAKGDRDKALDEINAVIERFPLYQPALTMKASFGATQ